MAAKTFALKVGIGAVDRLTRPFKRIQSVIDRTTGPVRRLTQRMAVMGRAAGVTKLKKAFTSLHRNVVGIGTAFRQTGTRIATTTALVAGGLLAIVKSTARAGDHAAKTSRALGITAEEYQDLLFAAKRSGVEQKRFDTGMAKLAKTLRDVGDGKGEALDFFERIGIRATDSEGRVRPLLDVVLEISEKIQRAGSAGDQLAGSLQTFGRGGASMVNLMKEGPEAIRALMDESERYGRVTNEGAKASEEFEDRWLDMMTAIRGGRDTLGVTLMPLLTGLITRVRDFLVGNRAQVEEWSKAFRDKLPGAARATWEWVKALAPAMKTLAGWLVRLSKNAKVIKAIAITLLAVALKPLLLATIALTKAVLGLAAAFVVTPIGQFVVLVGLAILAVKHWRLVLNFLLKVLWVLARPVIWFGKAVVKTFKFTWRMVKKVGSGFRWLGDQIVGIATAGKAAWDNFISGVLKMARTLASKLPRFIQRKLGLEGFASQGEDESSPAAVFVKRGGRGPGGGELLRSTSSAEVTVKVESDRPGVRAEVSRNDGTDIRLEQGLSLAGV